MSNQAILNSAFDDAATVVGFIADPGLRDAAMEAITAEHARRQVAFEDSTPVVLRRKPVEVPPGGSLLAELSKRALT